MPADAVRFIHQARDDNAKGRLFEAPRSGHAAVLIGSTAKMGVGTNVQNRLIAMWTGPGSPPTSSSATSAASGRETRTRKYRSIPTS